MRRMIIGTTFTIVVIFVTVILVIGLFLALSGEVTCFYATLVVLVGTAVVRMEFSGIEPTTPLARVVRHAWSITTVIVAIVSGITGYLFSDTFMHKSVFDWIPLNCLLDLVSKGRGVEYILMLPIVIVWGLFVFPIMLVYFISRAILQVFLQPEIAASIASAVAGTWIGTSIWRYTFLFAYVFLAQIAGYAPSDYDLKDVDTDNEPLVHDLED